MYCAQRVVGPAALSTTDFTARVVLMVLVPGFQDPADLKIFSQPPIMSYSTASAQKRDVARPCLLALGVVGVAAEALLGFAAGVAVARNPEVLRRTARGMARGLVRATVMAAQAGEHVGDCWVEAREEMRAEVDGANFERAAANESSAGPVAAPAPAAPSKAAPKRAARSRKPRASRMSAPEVAAELALDQS